MMMLALSNPILSMSTQAKKTELEYPAQQALGEEHQRDTLMYNPHERHE
jgi:hypothetical protein